MKLRIAAIAAFTVLSIWNSSHVLADIVTSRAIARIGDDETEVIDEQTNLFNELSATVFGSDNGVQLSSEVDAFFVSADILSVDVFNTWDWRGYSSGGTTVSFGRNFEYEFEADGTSISITGSNIIGAPLFTDARTTGLFPFRWQILDLTVGNGFQAVDFSIDGTQFLPTTVGHNYLLKLSDNSNIAGGDQGLGIIHSGSFSLNVPAKFSAVPEPSAGLLILIPLALYSTGRRRL